jgi:putative membrane protein
MWLDALFAYLHYIAILVLVGFLAAEMVLLRGVLDARAIRLLGKVDVVYFGSAMAALATGFVRLVFGAKGADFYMNAWPFYVKFALFVAVGIVSIQPTLAFIRWRRMLDHDPAWPVPDAERRRMWRRVMIEAHLAAMIPVFAVVMSRGLGR